MNNQKKKILMIGWEFPPFNSGGLGVACKGLAEALHDGGWDVSFTLPDKLGVFSSHIKFCFFPPAKPLKKDFWRYTYGSENLTNYPSTFSKGNSLLQRAYIYRDSIKEKLDTIKEFDIIHAHDWLSIPAALTLKSKTGKPLILHIHALEFDRAGGNDSWNFSEVSKIEREGLKKADKVIAVSQYTKEKIIECYNIDPSKIEVVYNGIEQREMHLSDNRVGDFLKKRKTILFVGRLTLQKGVDWFLKAAPFVLEKYPDAFFVIAGEGDQKEEAIKLTSDLGILKNVIFTGFLRPDELVKLYKWADAYVLPSVSEPFGITPLEAAKGNTPVIISKTSGVSEVLKSSLRVDFWDTKKMAASIIALIKYSSLSKQLVYDAKDNLEDISWKKAARKTANIYSKLVN